MHIVLSVALVAGYVIVFTYVALRARSAREYVEFSVARRALPLALIFGSICATYVGPAFSIGFVGRGFRSGFLFFTIGLAYAVQNILVGVLVAPRLRALGGCHTLGDAIGQKYSRECQIIAGVISVALCAGFATIMVYAGRLVLQDVFENVFHTTFRWLPWLSAAVVAGVTASYTTSGGLRASVVTDAFQFTAFSILMPIVLLIALAFHLEGGVAGFVEQARAATSDGFSSSSTLQIVGFVTAFLLGETLIPPYANRALASQSTRVSKNAFIMGGLFSIVWFFVMVSLGIVARGVVASETKNDHVLLKLVEIIMPHEGYALVLVVSMSIILSSLDSLMNAGAVAFTQDVMRPLRRLSDRAALRVGRVATVSIAIAAAVGALAVPDIIKAILNYYSIWASAILPALVLGLWLPRPRPLAGLLSMIVGAATAVLLQYLSLRSQTDLPPVRQHTDIPPILGGLAAALLAYLIGHLLGKAKPAPSTDAGQAPGGAEEES